MGYMYLNGQPGLGAEFVLKNGGAGEFPAESRPASAVDAEVDRTNHFNSIYHMWRVDPATGFYSAADDRLRKRVRSWQQKLGLRRDGIISLDLAKTLRVLAENWSTYQSSLRGLGEEVARTLKFPAQSDRRAAFYTTYKAETARTLGALVDVWVNFWLPEPVYSGNDYRVFKVCYDSKAPSPRVGSSSCSDGDKDHNVTDFWPREGVRGSTADWIDRLRSLLNVPAYWQSSKPEWRAFRRGLGVDELPHGSTYVIPSPGAAAAMRVYDGFRAKGEDLWQRHASGKRSIPLAACPQVKADAEFVVKQIRDNRELSAGQKALLISETGLSKLLTCGEYAASDVIKHAAKLTDALIQGDRTVCSQGVGATYGPLFKLVNPADGGWGTAAQAAAVAGFQRVAEGVCSGTIKPGEPAPAPAVAVTQLPGMRPGLDFSRMQWNILPGRRGEGQIPDRVSGGGGGAQASQAEIADLRAQLQALQAQAQAQQQSQGSVAPDTARDLAEVEQELEDKGAPAATPAPAPTSKVPLLIGGAVAAYLLFKS